MAFDPSFYVPALSEQGDEAGTHQRPAVILIGPGKHFGVELIRRFVHEGFAVGVVSARQSTSDQLREDLADISDVVRYVVSDVAQVASFQEDLQGLASEMGRVECLIYNPKHSISGSGLRTDPLDLSHSMAVNVTGALVSIQILLPFLAHSKSGSVILTGGGYKDKPRADKFALSVGKAGLHGLAKALRDPLRVKGVQLKTIVISGAVRRESQAENSSESLADFYWEVFSGRSGSVHLFPPRTRADDKGQLYLPV